MPSRIITASEAIREATHQAMEADERVIIIGEGVPDPKGIFGTTLNLRKTFGPNRVWDMPVAENAMTGICIGAAIKGFKPILTHQRVDFALLSLDQIINNAAKWFYMFGGQQSVPLVIRMIVGHGWGQGAQHSQRLHSLFAHIPGLKVVMPATPYDAKGLLLSSIEDPNPVMFIEHRWIHNIKGEVPPERYMIPLGKARRLAVGTDITIVASSFMAVEALRSSQHLQKIGITADVIDLRTIKPLDEQTIFASVKKTGRLLVVDDAHTTAGMAADIIARVAQQMHGALQQAPESITLPELPSPSTPALTKVYYPTYKTITTKVCEMFDKDVQILKKMWQQEDEKNMVPHDIPDPSFIGPF